MAAPGVVALSTRANGQTPVRMHKAFSFARFVAPAVISPALLVAGCDSSNVATGPAPVKCELTLTSPPSSIVSEGGVSTLSVTTQPECSWSVSTPANWISDLSPPTGQGSTKIEFRASANPAISPREGEIVVNDSRVRISQDGAICRFALSQTEETMGAAGGTGTVDVTALAGCTWIARTNDNWITVAAGTSGNGSGKVTFRVDPQYGNAPRTGTLSIAGRSFTVQQSAAAQAPVPSPPAPPPPPPPPPCEYAIDPTSHSFTVFGGAGQTVNVTTNSGCAWTAASNTAWISITSGASGSGPGSATFRVQANLGGERTGTLTIAGQSFTVTQPALVCAYDVFPSAVHFPQSGGTASIEVRTHELCTWTSSTQAGWIKITSGTTGSGNSSVSLLALPNQGAARVNSVRIAGRDIDVDQGP